MSREQSIDGAGNADVERHTVKDDVRNAQAFDDRADMGVGEDIEPVLVEQDVAGVFLELVLYSVSYRRLRS